MSCTCDLVFRGAWRVRFLADRILRRAWIGHGAHQVRLA
jgi:hypothetical protein